MIQKNILLVVIFFITGLQAFAQVDDPYKIDYYNFVHYKKNYLEFYGQANNYELLYEAFEALAFRGEGKINVVHIGGSHIQAGALPGHFCEKLQGFVQGLKGGRGYVFPYSLAGTNNPRDYKVNSTGNWNSCRNVERDKDCELGLSGMMVATNDSNASIEIALQELDHLPAYQFNVARIYHNTDTTQYQLAIPDTLLISPAVTDTVGGFTEYHFRDYHTTINLQLAKTSEYQHSFTLFGITLDTDEPGITYHGIGVNGSSIPSYLRCQLLEKHLAAMSPDWIILTLGTNDGYTRKFEEDYYESNYDELLTRLRRAAPNAAILLTVPNDSYLHRRYVNTNTEQMRDGIRKLAKRHNAAVWDFYGIMGELNSISLWHEAGLTANDKLHFNRRGYFLQADLMYNAFLKSYDNFLTNNRQIKQYETVMEQK